MEACNYMMMLVYVSVATESNCFESIWADDGEPLEEDPVKLVGRTLDGTYRLDALVGQGGFGMVFRAQHELLGDRVKAPDFEEILSELDWRAILFYIALFALVGGLEKVHLLDALAQYLHPVFTESYALGATLMYWATVPIVGIVEHDAYILTFLYTIRDLQAEGVPPWPLWWMMLWSGTLGSNLTVAGAPALFAALNICQREEDRKISLREFLAWSVPFTLVATAVCYVLGMLIWVLPFAK